ncbi:hypothetical protein EVAR_40547_1, partial [Eumeta japonica]
MILLRLLSTDGVRRPHGGFLISIAFVTAAGVVRSGAMLNQFESCYDSVKTQCRSTGCSGDSRNVQTAKKTHSYDSFEKLVNQWQSYEWLRNFSWVKETQQSFPTFKDYGQNVSAASIQDFVQE